MKPHPLLLLCCVLTALVSGAVRQRGPVLQLVTLALGEETAAKRHVVRRDHAKAAHSYARAAKHYETQARMIDQQGDDPETAANMYSKAAAMYAASGEQARAVLVHALRAFEAAGGERELSFFVCLVVQYAEMGRHREQGLMHKIAAYCYCSAAESYADENEPEQALLMHRAAVAPYEASVRCATFFDDREALANACSLAAQLYTTLGDADHARSLQATEAEQREAHAADQAACGEHGTAAVSYRKAAEAYRAIGDMDKSGAMYEAAAQHYQAYAVQQAGQGSMMEAAMSNRFAAYAYEAVGQDARACASRRAAAAQHEAVAIALAARGERKEAIAAYEQAGRIYAVVGEDGKARTMCHAAGELASVQ